MPYKKPAVDESALYTGVVKSRILKTSKKSKGKCTNRYCHNNDACVFVIVL